MKSRQTVILSGPSGVGKDTVLDAWTLRNPRIERVVASTTRAPREGELDGVDYTFLSEGAFLGRVDEGLFLEYKKVHSSYYGTPRSSVDAILDKGKIAILKIDVQGALSVMENMPEVISIFLLPPSFEELERRIRSRATENEEKILERLANARLEIEQSVHYQHRVVNSIIEDTVDELESILEKS